MNLFPSGTTTSLLRLVYALLDGRLYLHKFNTVAHFRCCIHSVHERQPIDPRANVMNILLTENDSRMLKTG